MEQDGEFKRGWPVLAAAAVGVGLGLSPLPFYTIGVMIPPLLQEFGPMGWTPGDILNALAIYTFGAFAASPIIGIMAERFGARRVALVSDVTFSLAMGPEYRCESTLQRSLGGACICRGRNLADYVYTTRGELVRPE